DVILELDFDFRLLSDVDRKAPLFLVNVLKPSQERVTHRPHASDAPGDSPRLCKGAVSAVSPAVVAAFSCEIAALVKLDSPSPSPAEPKLNSPSPSPAEPKLDSLCLLPSPTQTTLPVDDLPSPPEPALKRQKVKSELAAEEPAWPVVSAAEGAASSEEGQQQLVRSEVNTTEDGNFQFYCQGGMLQVRALGTRRRIPGGTVIWASSRGVLKDSAQPVEPSDTGLEPLAWAPGSRTKVFFIQKTKPSEEDAEPELWPVGELVKQGVVKAIHGMQGEGELTAKNLSRRKSKLVWCWQPADSADSAKSASDADSADSAFAAYYEEKPACVKDAFALWQHLAALDGIWVCISCSRAMQNHAVTELDGKKRLKPCAVALYTTKSLTINKGQSSMVLGASGENAEEDDAKDVD
ncbi:unnamed protein product, partial [Effrenium voratum]